MPTSKWEIRLSEWDPASVELFPAFCDIVVGAEENKDHEYEELDKHCCAPLTHSLMQSENTNQLVTKLLSTMCTANCEGPDQMYIVQQLRQIANRFLNNYTYVFI